MNILLSHCFYRSSAPSGEDAVYRNERALLELHGHTIMPLERFNDDIDDSTLAAKISLARGTVWSKSSYDAVTELIQAKRPDIAHFHNTFPQLSPSVYAACQDNDVPVVQSLHNFRLVCANGLLLRNGKPCEDCLAGGVINAIRHRCYRDSLPATSTLVWMQVSNRRRGLYTEKVNRYIVPSKFAIPRLIKGGLPENRLATKPNFLPNPPVFSGEREGFAVFVGRLTAEKGAHTLIEAWKKLPGLSLKILGDGKMRPMLEQTVREYSLDVEFLGYRPRVEVMHVVARAALQILPSECYEGFPMALLEAFASGTPVLVSRLGSLDELVVEGETGYKFDVGNADSLAQMTRQLMGQPAQLSRLGHRAREVFEENYTPDRNYEQLMAIYRDAIDDFALDRSREKRA
ncbi:MAG: glycosyltransferase family 4 protein [Burkholderiales bacterium]